MAQRTSILEPSDHLAGPETLWLIFSSEFRQTERCAKLHPREFKNNTGEEALEGFVELQN
jgi:hypothetical protein